MTKKAVNTTHVQNSFHDAQKCPPTVWVKKIPPYGFLKFFPKRLGILILFLHTYYTITSTLDYKFLFKYLQLWQSYAILSTTT